MPPPPPPLSMRRTPRTPRTPLTPIEQLSISSGGARGARAGGSRAGGAAAAGDSSDSSESPFAARPPSSAGGASAATPSPRPTGHGTPFGATPSQQATPASTVASTPLSQASQGSGKQNTTTVARIMELGQGGTSVVDIDRTLHREQFKTSSGTAWPAKNDGRVIVRMLLNAGITPVAGDSKIGRYVTEYQQKLEAAASRSTPSGKKR